MSRASSEAVDEDWLRDLFQPVGPINIRRMFGGAGVYRDGIMFALVSGGDVFLKCDAETAPRFTEAGCRPFLYERNGKTVEMSFQSLPEEATDDPEFLRFWADLAWQAAKRSAGQRRTGAAGSRSRKRRPRNS